MSFRSAPRAAKKLLSVVGELWSLEGQTMAVTASIGLFPDRAGDASALIQCTDAAMHRAKKAGKNAFAIARATRIK